MAENEFQSGDAVRTFGALKRKRTIWFLCRHRVWSFLPFVTTHFGWAHSIARLKSLVVIMRSLHSRVPMFSSRPDSISHLAPRRKRLFGMKRNVYFFFLNRAIPFEKEKRKGSKLQLSRQLLVIFTYASKRCAAVSPSRFILNGCKSRELRSILLYTKQLPLQCSWFIFFLND